MAKRFFSEAIDRPFLQSQRPTRYLIDYEYVACFYLNGIDNKGHESEAARGDYLARVINRGPRWIIRGPSRGDYHGECARG